MSVFLAVCLWGLGQGVQTGDNGGLVFKANARAVVIDVVVTGKNGTPQIGLNRQDFEVMENGKRQKIDSFEEHTGKPPVLGNSASGTNDSGFVATDLSASQPVTVLLLDGLNTQLQDQTNVRRQMFKYLLNPVPGQKMAVFVLGARLHSVLGFTDDPSKLAALLKDMKSGAVPTPSPLLQSPLERSAEGQLSELDSMGGGGTGVGALQAFLAEQEASASDLRLLITLDAFQQLARYLARIPGRKNLVWFSGAFPLALFPDSQSSDRLPDQRDHTEEVKKTDAALAAAQVAVYPIAAEGLATDSLADAGAQAVIHSAYDAQIAQTQTMRRDAIERNANQAAMDEIANDTGGQAYYNGNALSEALVRAIDHGAHFYTLSYAPTDVKTDGQFRKIKIKVRSAGGFIWHAAAATMRCRDQ